MYFPLIQSLIDYSITVWDTCNCAKSYLSLIQKLQNRTARIITQKHNYTKYSSLDLRRNLNWMSVTERYNYFMSILMFQCINNPVLQRPQAVVLPLIKTITNTPPDILPINLYHYHFQEQNSLKELLVTVELKFGIIFLLGLAL